MFRPPTLVTFARLNMLFCVMAGCFLQTAFGQVQPVYLNIPVVPGQDSFALGVNQSGQVVGYYFSSSAEQGLQDYIWQDGATTLMHNTGGHPPSAINNRGQVLLDSSDIWDHGLRTHLPPFPALLGVSFAESFNDLGQTTGSIERIAGYYKLDYTALFWSSPDSPPQQIKVPPFTVAQNSKTIGRAINNAGVVPVNANSECFLWRKDTTATLVKSADGSSVFCAGINDAGQVVGALTNPSAQLTLPFLWQSGALNPLPLPPGTSSAGATAVDSTGRILVASDFDSESQACWVWKSGSYTQLAGQGSACPSIAAVGAQAIVAGTCQNSDSANGVPMACIWKVD